MLGGWAAQKCQQKLAGVDRNLGLLLACQGHGQTLAAAWCRLGLRAALKAGALSRPRLNGKTANRLVIIRVNKNRCVEGTHNLPRWHEKMSSQWHRHTGGKRTSDADGLDSWGGNDDGDGCSGDGGGSGLHGQRNGVRSAQDAAVQV